MKRILVRIWNWLYDRCFRFRDNLQYLRDLIYRLFHKAPKVASIHETLQYILDTGCSVSRFGDAEMKVIRKDNISYQPNSEELSNRLIMVLNSPAPNHIVCLIDAFGSLDQYDEQTRSFFRKHLSYFRPLWYKYLVKDRQYYNSFMTRCYLMFRDKSKAGAYFDMLKKIWRGRNVLLVEGQKSRLGVGNDLFAECRQVKRILGPQVGAFRQYDSILEEILKFSSDEWLVLLALGPTATVLAYDLAGRGYQAIDIGNVDTEYEWYRMGTLSKVPVPNKYVHEAGGLTGDSDSVDAEYQAQIVAILE